MLSSCPFPDVKVIDESGRELHTIGKHLHQDFDRIGKSLVGELHKLLALFTTQAPRCPQLRSGGLHPAAFHAVIRW